MVTYCIETAVLEATRPIGAKAVAVANKANKAASLNIIVILVIKFLIFFDGTSEICFVLKQAAKTQF